MILFSFPATGVCEYILDHLQNTGGGSSGQFRELKMSIDLQIWGANANSRRISELSFLNDPKSAQPVASGLFMWVVTRQISSFNNASCFRLSAKISASSSGAKHIHLRIYTGRKFLGAYPPYFLCCFWNRQFHLPHDCGNKKLPHFCTSPTIGVSILIEVHFSIFVMQFMQLQA